MCGPGGPGPGQERRVNHWKEGFVASKTESGSLSMPHLGGGRRVAQGTLLVARGRDGRKQRSQGKKIQVVTQMFSLAGDSEVKVLSTHQGVRDVSAGG